MTVALPRLEPLRHVRTDTLEAGHRVIVPHLRGHGPTRFLDSATPRSGQQAAIGVDVIALAKLRS
jgi:hypothetical protein